uniref:Uncharacterized protein n=1 Tax=Echinococcus canadensis TaxID=519352 RepID=A0A915EXZ9_9CEST
MSNPRISSPGKKKDLTVKASHLAAGATSMHLSSSNQSFIQAHHGSLIEFDPKIQLMEAKLSDSYNSRHGGSAHTLAYEDMHCMHLDSELLEDGGMDELMEGSDLEMSDFETPGSLGSVSAQHFSPSNSDLTGFNMLFDDGSRIYLDCEKETRSTKKVMHN